MPAEGAEVVFLVAQRGVDRAARVGPVGAIAGQGVAVGGGAAVALDRTVGLGGLVFGTGAQARQAAAVLPRTAIGVVQIQARVEAFGAAVAVGRSEAEFAAAAPRRAGFQRFRGRAGVRARRRYRQRRTLVADREGFLLGHCAAGLGLGAGRGAAQLQVVVLRDSLLGMRERRTGQAQEKGQREQVGTGHEGPRRGGDALPASSPCER